MIVKPDGMVKAGCLEVVVGPAHPERRKPGVQYVQVRCIGEIALMQGAVAAKRRFEPQPVVAMTRFRLTVEHQKRLDLKSVVCGKSVSVRVDIGGRRILKKKNRTYTVSEDNKYIYYKLFKN